MRIILTAEIRTYTPTLCSRYSHPSVTDGEERSFAWSYAERFHTRIKTFKSRSEHLGGAVGGGGGGVNTYEPNDTPIWSFAGCAAAPLGACLQGTKESNGHIGYGGGVDYGFGFFAGLNVTVLSVNLNNAQFQLLGGLLSS